MKRPRPYALLALVVPAVLLVLTAVAPYRLEARHPPADFVAPMAPQEARARVATAQRADQQQRTLLAQQLGATDPASLPLVQTVFFAQTNHHISDRAGFLSFWRTHGGPLIFGYPLGEEIIENGRIVQYFERARFEYHPEYLDQENQVQLSLLGRELTAGRSFPDGVPDGGTVYFPETKHTLSGKFLQFWEKRGGLKIFGFPLSEPFEEISPIDGQSRVTQYFERARFEYHPEQLDGFYQEMAGSLGLRLAGLHEVQLGDLGRQAGALKGYTFATSTRLVGALEWAPTIWPRRIDVDLTAQHLVAYEGDTPVFRAPVATGRDGFNTPTGSYAIYSQYPMQTMTGSAGDETWYVPDIPWVQYVVGGVALHGTYWHDQWGTGLRMSHGCINLNIDDAQWLYEWADIGTQVDIHY
jgi:hypothetical protein